MSYRILIVNQRVLGRFSPEELLVHLRAVHYPTLCRQYGLDSALINPALSHLAVEGSENEHVPYFLVRYLPETQPPLVVNLVNWPDIRPGLTDADQTGLPVSVRSHLKQAQEVYALTLRTAQLHDLGLLLAYEIARWLAQRGEGLVWGLDGSWYRLNAYQAFIPVA